MDSMHLCDEARKYWDGKLAEDECSPSLSVADRHELDEHLKTCQPCVRWQKEVTDITVLVANMPEFSVSEALTQRILAAVETEKSLKEKAIDAVVWCGLAFTVLIAFLFVEAVETVSGVLSWAVAFAIMGGLSYLLRSPQLPIESKT